MRVLVTGAGSVMGQSIVKAIADFKFSTGVEICVANSDPFGAARYFSLPSVKVVDRPIFPLAVSPDYSTTVADYVRKNGIDIVYSGTQHELAKVSSLAAQGLNCATLPPDVTELCLDKKRCDDFLEKQGIRVPRTCRFDDIVDGGFLGRGIIKPNTSSASRGLRRFRHFSELSADERKQLTGRDMIVQEELVGDEYTCGCYVDRYSGVVSTIILQRTLTADGATGYGRVVHDERIERYVVAVARALGKAGLVYGHINVQLIVDPNGPCLFEINGRLSSTEYPKARFGFNSSAAYAVNLVEQRPFTDFDVVKAGKFLRYYEEVFWDQE